MVCDCLRLSHYVHADPELQDTGIEPCAYLKDVLERLPTMTNRQVSEMTPLKWKEARQRQPAVRQAP